ncbi:hypothetical protein WQ57_09785 [Mesobacillus campisalis]|uniref:Uncharacterized protein n=1 Tax=Mesobacillus campisalis TaxID=1408103 RepID=A0A0M2SYQ1_9BACI|nr:hypothetical protein [Mesobacillus campisalis]KKK38102.1 hypothetical protein WQ57_09785 [Mesobacillus campisalis]
MRKIKVLILSVVFLLTMSLPAMAQSNKSPSQSPYKGSYQSASFYGSEGTVDTHIEFSTNFEGKDSYMLIYHTYDYETDEFYIGSAEIPATKDVFDLNKGKAKVNATVEVSKVDVTCDDEGEECTWEETPAGSKSINLSWTFNPKSYSTSKYSDRNVQIGYDEYIKLSKGTFKNFNNVSVSGSIGEKRTDSFEYSGGGVTSGSSFTIIK